MSARRRRDQPLTYAPATEFTAAVGEWLELHRRRMGAHATWGWRPRADWREHGIRLLAERAGLNRALVHRVADGEVDFVTVRQADRLSVALDVPLRCLAEDFRPLAEWQEVLA